MYIDNFSFELRFEYFNQWWVSKKLLIKNLLSFMGLIQHLDEIQISFHQISDNQFYFLLKTRLYRGMKEIFFFF